MPARRGTARFPDAVNADAALRVAAGVIRDRDDRVLLSWRHPGQAQGGAWEFPGGKLRRGESARAALARELREELDIEVAGGDMLPLIRIVHAYPDRTVDLETFEVLRWRGTPRGMEGQPLEWVPVRALQSRPLLAANEAIRKAACLPRLCLVTPEPHDVPFLDGLRASLAAGVRLVQFRARNTPETQRRAFARQAVELCHAAGALCLINGDPHLVQEAGADGLHLSAAQLLQTSRRDLPQGAWISAACHDAAEIAAANRLDIDLGLLGPVAETVTHPGAVPLGWARVATLVAAANFPVYALGGQSPATLAAALDAGCQGIAAIRGLWMPSQPLPDARLRALLDAGE